MSADSTEIRREQAETLANRIVRDSFEQGRHAHFYTQGQREAAVRYGRGERDLAVAWVMAALLAGHTVFHKSRKRGWGSGSGLGE